jgi:hypothetical protein
VAHSKAERIDRLKAVVREFHVVEDAIERLRVAVADGRVDLPDGTTTRDLDAARRQLEATFLIRLWAEFETALRSYYGWLTNDPDPRIRSLDLVNAVAASRRGRALADAARMAVHEVRHYRNSLVHDRDDPAPAVPLLEARRRLNMYLGAKLPERWG